MIFIRRQFYENRRQIHKIEGKSVLVHTSDNRIVCYQRHDLRKAHTHDAHEIFGMLRLGTH